MAYDKNELEKLALQIIENDPDIIFIQDVIAEMPCSSATFYNFELEKLESLKSALTKNKVALKKALRTNWKMQDENATLQLALYKLAANDEEKDALTMQRTDLTTKGEKINNVIVEVVNATKDTSD